MGKDHLKTINTSSLTQQIIDRIKQGILTKEIRPGEQLPSKTELAKILGVSVEKVKEAVIYLTATGILEIRDNQAIFVSRGFTNVMFEPMIYGILLSQYDSPESLKEMRRYIEFATLHLAATRISKEGIKRMTAALSALKKELSKKNNLDNIVARDDQFYFTAFEASCNSLLINIIRTARTYTAENRKAIFKFLLRKYDIKSITESHEAIIQVFKTKKTQNLEEIIMNDPLYN